MTHTLDYTKLGHEARISADDAHEGKTPHVSIAWSFVLCNPECFIGPDELAVFNAGKPESEWVTMGDVEIGNCPWPEDMPAEAPIEFIAAYYRAI